MAAFVALAGALVATLASLIGLVISKESKISEFRQAWIDALRNDISELLGILTLLYQTNTAASKEEKHRIALLIGTLNSRILLRMNMAETESKSVRDALFAVHQAADSVIAVASGLDSSNTAEWTAKTAQGLHSLKAAKDEALKASQTLLKNEWERVKAGERLYALTLRQTSMALKWLFIGAGGVLTVVLIWGIVAFMVRASVPLMSR
jgi:hypothetical protein